MMERGRVVEEFSRILEMRVPRTLFGNNASERVGSIAREIGARRILILTENQKNALVAESMKWPAA
jgi:hypothetical protein